MKNIEQHKKERNESYKIFWLKLTNLNYWGPIFIFGVLALIFAFGTIYLTEQNNKIGAWLTTILTGICVKFLTDKLTTLKHKEKFENKGLGAVRNLDTILVNILKMKDRKRIEDVDYIEQQIIDAIEDWGDIVPDLKYRDRVNKAREFNKKIKDLKKENENKDFEIGKLENDLQLQMEDARKHNLNSVPPFSGGTASNY
jgi:hypothetical protein